MFGLLCYIYLTPVHIFISSFLSQNSYWHPGGSERTNSPICHHLPVLEVVTTLDPSAEVAGYIADPPCTLERDVTDLSVETSAGCVQLYGVLAGVLLPVLPTRRVETIA